LAHLTPVTLTFDPVTQRSIGSLCYPGWMCGPSLKKVVQGILKELLIRNEKVTDRPTGAKQYALSSSKGGIKTLLKLSFLSSDYHFSPLTIISLL